MPGINQFFGIGARGLNGGFRIISKAKVISQNNLPHYSSLDNRNLRLYIRFLIDLRLK